MYIILCVYIVPTRLDIVVYEISFIFYENREQLGRLMSKVDKIKKKSVWE